MLSWASQQIEKLSEKVAPPPTDASGRFVYCMQRHDEEGAMAALAELPDPNTIVVQQTKGATALHVACQSSSARVIRHLLLQPGASLNIVDNAGNTPLHYACMTTDKEQGLAVVKMLVTEFKASVVAKNGQGQTPYDVASANGIRQYLLPLQLQQETQQALDNGGVGLPPGIDLGGLRVNNVAPPPQMAPHSAPSPATPYSQAPPLQQGMLTTPSPTGIAPPQQTTTTSPSSASRPPMAPSSGNSREYARTGSSSAAIYTGGSIKPDGFHSSDNDVRLQKLYNHSTSQKIQVAPPPRSGNSAPSSLAAGTSVMSRGRYPVYDARSGRTTPSSSIGGSTPPHSFGNTPPHSGNVFNPAAAAATPPHSGNAPLQYGSPQYQNNASPAADGASNDGGLPEGWTQAVDPTSGKVYFINAAQNLTTWERPTATPVPLARNPSVTSSVASAEELFAGPSPEKQENTGDKEELPEGWTEVMDPNSGRPYFYHAADNVTTWERPANNEEGSEQNAKQEESKKETTGENNEAKKEEQQKEETTLSEAVAETKETTPADSTGAEEPKAKETTTPSAETTETVEQPDANSLSGKEEDSANNKSLPEGWTEVVDPNSGRPYFYNATENITTWERPSGTRGPYTTSAEPEQTVTSASPEQTTEPEETKDQNPNAADVFAGAAPREQQDSSGASQEEKQEEEKPPTETTAEEKPVEQETTTLNGGGHEQVRQHDKQEPSANSLPQGWTEAVDPASGRSYYHNAAQNVTTWERPEDTSLPEGWTEALDPTCGRTYYCHAAQNITTWERPQATTPSMPVPQAATHVVSMDSTASAQDVFAGPSPEKKTDNEIEKPDMPNQRAVTEDTAKSSSSSSAAELFASPPEPVTNGASIKPDTTSAEPATKETEVNNNGTTSDSMEDVMSEVPLEDENSPAESASQVPPDESETLFTAIGLPPPPFRSTQ